MKILTIELRDSTSTETAFSERVNHEDALSRSLGASNDVELFEAVEKTVDLSDLNAGAGETCKKLTLHWSGFRNDARGNNCIVLLYQSYIGK